MIECLQWTINHGANVNCTTFEAQSGTTNAYTPSLKTALALENVLVAKFLVSHGAYVEIRGHEKNTPLMAAIYHQNLDLVSLLLDHGAKIDSMDASGRTPVIIALQMSLDAVIKNKYTQIFMQLLERKHRDDSTSLLLPEDNSPMFQKTIIDVFRALPDCSTPAHYAAACQEWRLIKRFLARSLS